VLVVECRRGAAVLLARLSADPTVPQVVAGTLAGHVTSRPELKPACLTAATG
jgi:hypothetical protein